MQKQQPNLNTSQIRHIHNNINKKLAQGSSKMDASAELSFLNCYICFQSLKKPKMCPSCSKVACEKCLRTWIEDNRPECPHCRKVTPLNSFAECERFISDVKHLLNEMEKNQKVKQKCTEHRIQMTYYCEDCQVPICSDCGMFGDKHKKHKLTHLKKIYQEYKSKVLNELARFDQKIEGFRKNGYQIKFEMQKLVAQIGLRKSFIEEYFVAILERLEEEFKQKQEKIKQKYEENAKEVQFLQNFRENICRQLQSLSEKQVIEKSSQLVNYIQSVCDRGPNIEHSQYNFDTIHEIVPKYSQFRYVLKNYETLGDGIIYSEPYVNNGIEWRLKIYPKGNGLAKDTHMSVFLEMTKGFSSGNKYEYKIELLNNKNNKDSVIREYSSNFDIGECWGYNQFIPIQELNNDFLTEGGDLLFVVNVRNPSYRSLVRDQRQYVEYLEAAVARSSEKNIEQPPSNEKVGASLKLTKLTELKKQSKDKIKKILYQKESQKEKEQTFPKMNRIHSSRVERKMQRDRDREQDERYSLSAHNEREEDMEYSICESLINKLEEQK